MAKQIAFDETARRGLEAGMNKLADAVRPESRDAIDALHARGAQVVMITGDAEAVAHHVADGRELVERVADDLERAIRGMPG